MDMLKLARHRGIRIHVVESPGVAIGVEKSMGINESQILGSIVSGASVGNGFGNEVVNLLLAVAEKAENRAGGTSGVRNGFGREMLEGALQMDHHMDVVCENHALTVWPTKDGVRVESKLSVKIHCSFEVLDWDVDEYGIWFHGVEFGVRSIIRRTAWLV